MDTRLHRMLGDAGAFSYAVIAAMPVQDDAVALYDSWLERGGNLPLDYMSRWREVRNDPRLLITEEDGGPAHTLIVCLFAYPHPTQLGVPDGIAHFAHAVTDYHNALKAALLPVAAAIDREYGSVSRVCVDSAPLRERYWAARAGLGRIRRNNHLYADGYGANFHIATIVTTARLPEAQTPPPLDLRPACPNSCRLCVDACPTGALHADGTLDCSKCLSCITIETARCETQPTVNRNGAVFGCDTCRMVCPHTRASQAATPIEALLPNPALETSVDWCAMTPSQFKHTFNGTALRRAGLKGILNNLSHLK